MREFVASSSALQEMLKEVHRIGNDIGQKFIPTKKSHEKKETN